MQLNGFSTATTSQTYHHTQGKVRSYGEVDRGEKEVIRDEDPREGFLSYASSKVILDSNPDKELSYFSQFKRGEELTLTREWSHGDGYQELEVRRSELGTVTAQIHTLENGQYHRYQADQATANSLLGSMEADFAVKWNVAK